MEKHSLLEPIGNDRLLLVNLPKTYPDGIGKEAMYKRENLYDKVRQYWKLNIERARLADYVIGVYKGKVVAVFKPTDWVEVENKNLFIGKRCAFICDTPDPISESPYLTMDATHYFDKCRNPIRYIGY